MVRFPTPKLGSESDPGWFGFWQRTMTTLAADEKIGAVFRPQNWGRKVVQAGSILVSNHGNLGRFPTLRLVPFSDPKIGVGNDAGGSIKFESLKNDVGFRRQSSRQFSKARGVFFLARIARPFSSQLASLRLRMGLIAR